MKIHYFIVYNVFYKEKSIDQEYRQQEFENYHTTDDHLMHIVGIVNFKHIIPANPQAHLIIGYGELVIGVGLQGSVAVFVIDNPLVVYPIQIL